MLGLLFVRSSRNPPDGRRRFTLLELWLFLLLVVGGVIAGYSIEGVEALDALVEHIRQHHRHG